MGGSRVSSQFHTVFDHEKLEAYRLARQFMALLPRITRNLRGPDAWIFRSQLVRAALSILANIAEGAGEFLPGEKAKFYRYAMRSAQECVAILDGLVDYSLLKSDDIQEARQILRSIVNLLVRTIRNLDARRRARTRTSKTTRTN
jgi:four helix bundle protein